MSGTSILISIADQEARQGFARLSRAMKNTKPIMNAIGTGLVRNTRRRFRTQTGPDGQPWAALNPVYAAEKRNTRILTESGRLRDSITHAAQSDEVRVGSNVIYAAIHQHGGTIKAKSGGRLAFKMGGNLIRPTSVTLPARPYLGIDNDDRAMIGRVIERFLSRALP